MKLKSVNDMHVIVYLKPYLQHKTIKIIHRIFTKFKDLSTLKIFTRPGLRQAVLPSRGYKVCVKVSLLLKSDDLADDYIVPTKY